MFNLKQGLEHVVEQLIFASRWLLAPLYLGMGLALLLLLWVFMHELVSALAHFNTIDAEGSILLALSLIDLSLTANLLLIVMRGGGTRNDKAISPRHGT
jgi:uncharacterized protein (TIGR00645 family)